MGIKPRSPNQTAFSVSMEEALRDDIDARAESLGLNRSQYLATLARNDIATGGDLLLREPSTPAPLAAVAEPIVSYRTEKRRQKATPKPAPSSDAGKPSKASGDTEQLNRETLEAWQKRKKKGRNPE